MPDYFYVKNSIGARTTGGGTTKQSGDFATLGAAAVYATVALAVADGAGAGDIICVSDAHVEGSYTAHTYLTGPSSGDFLSIISVEDLNCETTTVASTAQFDTTGPSGAFDIYLDGRLYLYGLYMKSQDNITAAASTDNIEESCTREVVGGADVLCEANGDGVVQTFINPNWIGHTTGTALVMPKGAKVSIVGGSLANTTNHLTVGSFDNGGGVLRLRGFDISSIVGTLFKTVGGAPGDDLIDILLDGCKLNAGLTAFTNEDFSKSNHRVSVYHSAATSAAAEYQFHIVGKGGYVDDQDDSGIHRDESTAFPSGTKVSAHCVTNSTASIASPFWFDLPAQPIDLSSASTDTIRIYLTSTAALDDLDVWAEVLYPDGTNQHEYHTLSSRNTDRLATSGTALVTDSGSTWKDGVSDLAGYNEYYIDLDTSGNAGAECVPIIRIYVSTEAIIYFDTSIEAVA